MNTTNRYILKHGLPFYLVTIRVTHKLNALIDEGVRAMAKPAQIRCGLQLFYNGIPTFTL
jgi:hypothetical protein